MMYGINVEKMNLYIIVYAKFDGNQLNIKVKTAGAGSGGLIS